MENDIVICAAATLELVGKKADIYLIEIAEIGDAEKFEDAIEKEEKNEKIITKVLKKLKSRIKLWHDADRKGYATFRVEKHQESWPIDSKTFRDYIEHFVFKNPGLKIGALGKTLLDEICNCLSAQAKFEGSEFKIHKRVAKFEDRYYIDLCNSNWQLIEIDPNGWKILDKLPEKAVTSGNCTTFVPLFKFIRSANARPLPLPGGGGNYDDLFQLCNIPEDDHMVVLAWILECFRPDTPYPVLEITGEQGSAKSTTQEVLRSFIDPNRVMLRAKPKAVEDIYIAAYNSHLISYENLSSLTPDMSDALCVIATGGGFAARTLYTNLEETVLNAHAPIVLNGINKVVIRPDLVDRAISIDLPNIENRISENQHYKMLEELAPSIFGGLLDLLVKTLKVLPSVYIDPTKLPRMADFTKLGEAMSQAMGNPGGHFVDIYTRKRDDASWDALEASPTANAILKLMEAKIDADGDYEIKIFEGTVGELLEKLKEKSEWDHRNFNDDSLPRNGKGLSNAIRRLSPVLRKVGIFCEFGAKTNRGNLIKIYSK